MAKVRFKRIQDSTNIGDLNIEDGSFIVTGDGKTYIDYGTNRVPTSGTPDSTMSDSSRNTVENKVIKEYVDDNINDAITDLDDNLGYEIGTSGEWTYKKYNDGLVEMWHRHVESYTLNEQYASSTLRWKLIGAFNFPIELTQMISINTTLGTQGHLIGCNYDSSGTYTSSYKLYIYEYGQPVSNQSISINTTIIGKWK